MSKVIYAVDAHRAQLFTRKETLNLCYRGHFALCVHECVCTRVY